MSELAMLENPAIAALLNAHAQERAEAAMQADFEQVEQTAEAERMYLFRGELYAAEDLPKVCPYLGSLSMSDRAEAMSSYEYRGTQPEPIEVPIDHPNVTIVRAQKQIQETPLEIALEPTKAETVPTAYIIEASESGGEMPMGGPDEASMVEVETSPSAVVVEAAKPAVQVTKVVQDIKKPVAVTVLREAPKIPKVDVIAETAGAPIAIEQIVVKEVELTQEVQTEVQTLEILDMASSEPVERLEPIAYATELNMDEEVESAPIDLELLATVEPQLAQTVAAIAEHSGAETLKKPKTSMLTAETAESVTEYLETAAPEQAVAVEAIVVLLETAANRLTTLAQKEVLNETEATAIVEFIVEWYGELAQRGVSVTEKTAYEFVAQILKEAGVPQADIQCVLANWQDGTREFKLQNPHSLSQIIGINSESRSDRWPLGWLYALVA